MAGAQRVLSSQAPGPADTPPQIQLLRMTRSRAGLPETDAALWPLLPELAEDFFTDLPQGNVPGSGRSDAAGYGHPSNSGPRRRLFRPPGRNPSGIGQVEKDTLLSVVSCRPGAGWDVTAALLSVTQGDTVRLQVARTTTGQSPSTKNLDLPWWGREHAGGKFKMDKICGHAVPGRRARILYPFVTKLSQDGDGRTDEFAVW